MAAGVRDIDHGWQKTLAELKKSARVRVGILGDAGSDEVMIAAVQEFGSTDGRVPQRSFLRATIDEQRESLLNKFENLLRSAAQGKQTTEQATAKFGMLVVSAVREKIRGRIAPANKPATIKRKGSDMPLIDTGRLIQSIKSGVVS